MSEPDFACATAARERCDPHAGTAFVATRYLLIEHDGRWEFDAFGGSGIDLDVRVALTVAIRSAGARLLLIRRPGRRSNKPRQRAWAVLDDRPDVPDVWGTWEVDADLRSAAVALDGPMRMTPVPKKPVFLVCTQGLHDQCCAIRGRPVAEELGRRWPEETWECSHVGGDRFAANLIVLPSSTYYGNVGPAEAVAVVADHLDGRVDPAYLRGFGSEPPPAQAAAIEAHRRYGPTGPDAFASTKIRTLAPDRWLVLLRGSAGMPPALEALVTAHARPPARLTCQAEHATSARQYVVESLAEPAR